MLGLIQGVNTRTQKINEVPLEIYMESLVLQEQEDRVLFTKRRKLVLGKLPKEKKDKTEEQKSEMDPTKTPNRNDTKTNATKDKNLKISSSSDDSSSSVSASEEARKKSKRNKKKSS